MLPEVHHGVPELQQGLEAASLLYLPLDLKGLFEGCLSLVRLLSQGVCGSKQEQRLDEGLPLPLLPVQVRGFRQQVAGSPVPPDLQHHLSEA
ncbi:hypothetical protein ES703_117120 [subsurface metagenome]